MKVYVIVELGFEYNDEYYECLEPDGLPLKAYKRRESALAECVKLNEQKLKASPLENCEREPYTEYYQVKEIELTEDDLTEATPGQRYQRLCEERDQAAAKAVSIAREAFMEGTKILFEQFPEMQSFGWRQYTPYFNDGDECRFGVHADEPDINGESSADFDLGYTYQAGPNGRYEKIQTGIRDPRWDWANAVVKFVYSFPKDDLKALFGDHVQVTVHRNGTATTENYHHD